MDFLVGVSALASVVAAVTGVLNYRSNIRRARRAREDEAAARWSMEILDYKSGERVASIFYGASAPQIRIIALRGRSPRGLSLQLYSHKIEQIGPRNWSTHLVPDKAGPRRELELYRDTNSYAVEGGTISVLFYLPPPRPWRSRNAFTRLRISVRYEDRSANRRMSTIELTSAQIPWISAQTVAKTE